MRITEEKKYIGLTECYEVALDPIEYTELRYQFLTDSARDARATGNWILEKDSFPQNENFSEWLWSNFNIDDWKISRGKLTVYIDSERDLMKLVLRAIF